MATKTKRVKEVTALRVWRGNMIDQEELVNDQHILTTFSECREKCLNPGRPLTMQIAAHVAWCLNLAFEDADMRAFTSRTWDSLLGAMDNRNGEEAL